VQRLRDSLSDTAEKAMWIETVPPRGYRFVGSVEWTKSDGFSGNSTSVANETRADKKERLRDKIGG
jgi:DNA-binding winged helix-turn-helix (wHTH) protein